MTGICNIGIGLGLQNMAANVISGFSIIFGGKIRKGDWIEAEGTLGSALLPIAGTTVARCENK